MPCGWRSRRNSKGVTTVKAIEGTGKLPPSRGPLTRVAGLVALLFYALLATVAQASTVLISDTTLVSGSETAVFSFEAPGPGTVSVQLTNLDWPQALSSLSFMSATASRIVSPWANADSGTWGLSFQVAGPGAYFADIMAVAGGPLDLGAYSFSLNFTPAAPVPLPASGTLLLGGLAGLIGLILWRRGALASSSGPLAPLLAR